VFTLVLGANVESQGSFIKIALKGNGKRAKALGVAKPEAYHADERFPVERVQYRARWDVLLQ
jgi:hypothetical protein